VGHLLHSSTQLVSALALVQVDVNQAGRWNMAEIALLPRRLAEWSGTPPRSMVTRSSLGGVSMMPTAELLVVESSLETTLKISPLPKQLSTKRRRRRGDFKWSRAAGPPGAPRPAGSRLCLTRLKGPLPAAGHGASGSVRPLPAAAGASTWPGVGVSVDSVATERLGPHRPSTFRSRMRLRGPRPR
jgi:hypothetical protein